jgi:hypothetical protein
MPDGCMVGGVRVSVSYVTNMWAISCPSRLTTRGSRLDSGPHHRDEREERKVTATGRQRRRDSETEERAWSSPELIMLAAFLPSARLYSVVGAQGTIPQLMVGLLAIGSAWNGSDGSPG